VAQDRGAFAKSYILFSAKWVDKILKLGSWSLDWLLMDLWSYIILMLLRFLSYYYLWRFTIEKWMRVGELRELFLKILTQA